MKSKKNIAKGIIVATALANTPIESLANMIEEDKATNIEYSRRENNIEDGIKKFFAKIVEPIENLIPESKEIVKVNKNILKGSVLEITLSSGQYVENLSGNPGGYETVKVTTTGGKKLVEEDYNNLRLSGIPKIDLSNASSNSIPAGAFSGATHLTEFKFPQGITSVGGGAYNNGAFRGCSNLVMDLVIPDSVTWIGAYAFAECSGLTGNLVLPEGMTSIGMAAFQDCSGLTGNLVIPEGITRINNDVFYGCSGFNGNLVIPESVTSIEGYAFRECSGLTGNLVIPDNVTRLGAGAFQDCSGLTGNLVIPEGVTIIGAYAFQGCSGFNGNLVIPNTVTNISGYAFYGCSGLTGELVIPNNARSIGYAAFYHCSGLTGSLVIPNGVTSIGGYAFSGCAGFNGNLVIPNTVASIDGYAFYGCSGLTGELVIPDGLISIGKSTFYDCSGLAGILTIPESVTSIGEYAFRGCSGFDGGLVVPEGVTTIGKYAFYGCSGFNDELVLPSSLESVGEGAFYNCSGFKGRLVIPEGVTNIDTHAFRNCTGFTGDLIIPSGVTSIGSTAFYDCTGFNGRLVIPDSVINIGEYAFRGCSGLTGELVIPNSVTSIGKYAFCLCSGFTGDLVIPSSLTSLEEGVFYESNGFDGKLILPDTLTFIGDWVFTRCDKFTGNLTIPNSVTNIGGRAFFGCSGFTGNLVIPESITTMGYRAFNECSGIKIIVKIDERHISGNYRKDIIENLPKDNTYIEMSYNFDIAGTWLETTNYIKAKPTISAYTGVLENNEGMGILLEAIEASNIQVMNILKDGRDYSLEKNENGKYIFNENGEYQIYIETELGTISNISFKNVSPIFEPSLNFDNNVITIVNNGIIIDKVFEDFNNASNLKYDFSNSNWAIENGILKSEIIPDSGNTENEFKINAKVGDKLQVKLKTSSKDNDWGYIYLNGVEAYKKSGTANDFEIVELDLQEGENTIKFKYVKDNVDSDGDDAILIDYVRVLKNEVTTVDCDVLEYRVNSGEWQVYNGSIELNYPNGTKVQLEIRAKHDGFISTVLSKEIIVETINIEEIEDAIEKAEQSNDAADISNARDLVNQMPESSKKDVFQGRLDAIFPNLTFNKETASANMDVYIKSENMLSLSLNTNAITFENFNGTEDLEKPNAVELTINSSLPYDVNAYLATKIENANKDKELDKDLLKIRAHGTADYKNFTDIGNTATTLLTGEQAGNNKKHSIDLKLRGSDAVDADIYKTTIKFEVTQK